MSISRTEAMLVAGGIAALSFIGYTADKSNVKASEQAKRASLYEAQFKAQVPADVFIAKKNEVQFMNCALSSCVQQWQKLADSATKSRSSFEAGKQFALDSLSKVIK